MHRICKGKSRPASHGVGPGGDGVPSPDSHGAGLGGDESSLPANLNHAAASPLPKIKATGVACRFYFGAANEARTRYLHLGKVALYQMSYGRITL